MVEREEESPVESPKSPAELFQRFGEDLFRFLYWRCDKNQSLAQDLTQEIFLQLLRRFDTLDLSSPWPLLIATAKNLLAKHYRNSRNQVRRVEQLAKIQSMLNSNSTFEMSIDDSETRQLIEEIFCELEPAQSLALKLKYEGNLGIREISQHLGRSEKAVESLLGRARKNFIELFEKTKADE